MTMTAVTATIYTNQWVRISGRMRPTNYLLLTAASALLLGAAVGLANRDVLVAIEAFCISLALGSALVILLWRRGQATEINLGAQKVRSGKSVFSFSEITDLDLHTSSSNLYLVAGNRHVLLPLFWLGHDQIKVIERMVRLLADSELPEGRVEEVRQHLLGILSD